MKAAVYRRYGAPDVVTLAEVPTPTPKEDEVLIKVHATTVSSGDWRVRSLKLPAGFGPFARLAFGVFGPRQPILGTELSGEIVAVGNKVDNFQPGERVFAMPGVRMGAHAEYVTMRASGAIALKPPRLTDEEAAALSFGGTTALNFLRRGNVKSGDKLLINGASGAVGSAAVQLGRHFGAEVTAVCSAGNHLLVRALGAAHVIDYRQEDFTKNGETYDVIMDTAGTAPFSRCQGSLKAGGRLLAVLAGLPEMVQIPWQTWTTKKTIIAGPAPERAEDLRLLGALAESGVYKPVIDRRYTFDQIVEAHHHVDTGHKRGSVVVVVAAPSPNGKAAPASVTELRAPA
jgi:NADPH:quinone reductase-like Zn-dependent oxidoreductase